MYVPPCRWKEFFLRLDGSVFFDGARFQLQHDKNYLKATEENEDGDDDAENPFDNSLDEVQALQPEAS